MLFVHALVGGLTTHYILKSKKQYRFDPIHLNIIWFFGVLGSVLPDFDISLLFFVKHVDHRLLLTHSIIPYTLLFIFINVFCSLYKSKKLNTNFVLMLNLVLYVGVLSHFLIDYFYGGFQLQ